MSAAPLLRHVRQKTFRVGPQAALIASAACLLAVALGRVHVRVQTTLVGYEIGQMKSEEAKLLEERSYLKMQLAKLTTKKHLELMTETERPMLKDSDRTVAQK